MENYSPSIFLDMPMSHRCLSQKLLQDAITFKAIESPLLGLPLHKLLPWLGPRHLVASPY